MKRLAILVVLFAPIAGADVLFESDEPLTMSLSAPFRTIDRAEDKSVEWPATLQMGENTFDVELSLRGNYRLRNCRFPPLRVDFDNDAIKDTLFDKQKDIKLVVQCNNGASFTDFLRTEYLTYKAMLALTPMAYRARWVQVEYVDTDRNKTRSAPAFFVERKSRVAKRHAVETTDIAQIDPSELRHDHAAVVLLFAYLISNADFSIIRGATPDECCHNAKLLQDGAGRYYPLLYDFDNSGLVDASYSAPSPAIGVYDVTQRLYRGYCEQTDDLEGARALMLENEAAIMALFTGDSVLSPKQRRKTERFLKKGFDTFRSDDLFSRNIRDACR